jgi:uncharacterized protein (DUF4415 family)
MKKIIYTLFLTMLVHAVVMAQPNDRRQGPPPPPPREYERGEDRGQGPRRGDRMRPEQREKIEMFKIQFITKNLELSAKEAEGFWPVYEAHKKAMQEIIKTKMSDEILMQEAMLNARKKYKADLMPVLKTEERVNKALRVDRDFLDKMRKEVSKRRGWN